MSRASRKAGHVRERRVQRWFARALRAEILRKLDAALIRDFRMRERRPFEFFGPVLPIERPDLEMRLRWSPVFKPQHIMRVLLPVVP